MNGKTHSTPGFGPLTVAQPLGREAVVETGGDAVVVNVGAEGREVVWFVGLVVGFPQLEEQKPQLP